MLARALSVQTDNIAQRIDWQSPDAQAQSDLLYSKAALIEDYYYLKLEDLNINLILLQNINASINQDL